MNIKQLNNIRDCVRLYLGEGARDKYEFKHMRYGIICELKRLGLASKDIKNIMSDWNDRNYKKLNHKEFAQQIESFIEWVFKKDAKAGCNYFEGDCIPCCRFKEKIRKDFNKESAKEPLISQDDIEEFITTHHKDIKNARDCAAVWKAMDKQRVKNCLLRKSIIYIGYRDLAILLGERGYMNANAMFACRIVKQLSDTSLLEIVEKGKKGNFNQLANGYKLNTPVEALVKDFQY
ncbi:hypothetical protein ACFL2G_05315 [Candidatus Omnitrophota bacterium]